MEPYRRPLTDSKIEKVLKVINLLRLYDREFSAQVMATLLYVASHNECHKQALEEDLNFTTASGSRNTDRLSKFHRLIDSETGQARPGLGLIKKRNRPRL